MFSCVISDYQSDVKNKFNFSGIHVLGSRGMGIENKELFSLKVRKFAKMAVLGAGFIRLAPHPQGAVSLKLDIMSGLFGRTHVRLSLHSNMLCRLFSSATLNHKKRRNKSVFSVGRGDMIRTCDTLLPKQVLYQAELRPDAWYFILFCLKNQVLF